MSSNNFHYQNEADMEITRKEHKPNRTINRNQSNNYGGARQSTSPRERRRSQSNRARRSRSQEELESRTLRNQNKPSNFRRRSVTPPASSAKLNLDIKVFIKEKFLSKSGLFTFSSLEQIIKQNGCDDIFIDEKEIIPDLAGKILVIKSKYLEQKVDAYLSIMRRIEDSETLLFIPQQLVSMVIGTKGRTINGIKRDIGCEIFVNQ